MAPAEFSLQCANFAKRSYQSPTNAWDSGGHTSPLSYFNFAARVRVPASERARALAVWCLTQLIFVHPSGFDPMLEHDGPRL
jgi:hypothetical protein